MAASLHSVCNLIQINISTQSGPKKKVIIKNGSWKKKIHTFLKALSYSLTPDSCKVPTQETDGKKSTEKNPRANEIYEKERGDITY